MDKGNNPSKNKIKNFAAIFEQKKNEDKKDEKPKEKPKLKKINAQELLDKMNSEHKEKELLKKQNQSQNSNTKLVNNNFVKNSSKQLSKKEEELKQKKIEESKVQEERKEKAKITISKTMEMQKAKLKQEKEKKEKEEERKRIMKEEKIKKEKEFKEKNDKERTNILTHFSWREDARDKLKKRSLNKKYLSKNSEDQEVNIFMDFSSRLGNIVISGYEEKMVTYKFPNCIKYYNDEIRNRFNSRFFCDDIENNFSREIVYPVNKGVFNDYDLLELLIGYANIDYINFNFIEECGIIFTESINTDNDDRNKIAETLFYTFDINKLFIIKPSVMTLLREGKLLE